MCILLISFDIRLAWTLFLIIRIPRVTFLWAWSSNHFYHSRLLVANDRIPTWSSWSNKGIFIGSLANAWEKWEWSWLGKTGSKESDHLTSASWFYGHRQLQIYTEITRLETQESSFVSFILGTFCSRMRIGLACVICPSLDESLWSEGEALWAALPYDSELARRELSSRERGLLDTQNNMCPWSLSETV